jgi:hypothetical protein
VLVVGLVLVVVSVFALVLLQRPMQWLRRSVDDVADVAAVNLARHPGALAAVLTRLAADDRRVGSITDRSEFVWFEMVGRVDQPATSDDAAETKSAEQVTRVNTSAHSALERRAALAAATARGLAGREASDLT